MNQPVRTIRQAHGPSGQGALAPWRDPGAGLAAVLVGAAVTAASNWAASLTMPLLLLSGILLPMSLAPAWLRAISKFNLCSWAVDASRTPPQRRRAGLPRALGCWRPAA